MKTPKIFVLSGPAGAGKTTLINRLLRKLSIQANFIMSTSFTTRKRRPQEKEGKDYFFVNKSEFLKLKRRKFFLESQRVVDDYYGTARYFYTQAIKEKKGLILCIDVKGGIYLKENFKLGKIITIFISAPGRKELYNRLQKRVEAEEVIKKRLKLAKKELQFSKHYDYVIVNQDLTRTSKVLEAILLAEEYRR